MEIQTSVATWAEREPERFIGRRRSDRDQRVGERRGPDRRSSDRRCPSAARAGR